MQAGRRGPILANCTYKFHREANRCVLADDNNTRRKCDGVRIVSQLSKAEVLIKWKEMSW